MHPTDPSQPLGERLQGTNLYLVGMMGSGKSTVGPLLAKALGYRFLDADAVISQAAGCSIPEIFERDGEEGFRRLERQVLQQLSQWHSLVVATGGGIVTVVNFGRLVGGEFDPRHDRWWWVLYLRSMPRIQGCSSSVSRRLDHYIARRHCTAESARSDSPNSII